ISLAMTHDHLPLLNEEGQVNPQLMAYSRLFQSEIGEFIYANKSMHLQYLKSLDANDVDVNEFRDWFVLEILRNEETFRILHDQIEKRNPTLHSLLHMGKATDNAVVDVYKKYFLRPSPFTLSDLDEYSDEEEIDEGVTVVDRISQSYHPDLTYLKTHYPSLGQISDPVKHPLHSTDFNYRPHARAILRYLPNLKSENFEIPSYPSLVYHFAKACVRNPLNVPTLMYLLPDYSTKMAERDSYVQSLTNTDRVEEEKIEPSTKFRDPDEFKEHRKTNEKELDSDIPILREYQKELTEKAEAGENTVIVAPTGSGKTVVAAHIIRQHIERRSDMGKGARVIIVAPTVPLVSQHGIVLYRYLRDVAFIDYLHGNIQLSKNDRIEALLSNNLVICTPQLLINCLQSVRREDRLFISDFSLLILDECHHTCEKHPYAQLMTMVRKAEGDVPQVVGMTASLGIGKKGLKDVDSGVDHVKSLLARMGATSISTVVNHVEEMGKHVHRPTDQIEEISRPSLSDSPFTSKIIEFIVKIRKFLIDNFDKYTIFNAEFCLPKHLVESLKQVACRSNARFTGILNDFKSRLNRMRSGVDRTDLVDGIDMILAYTKALDMNDLLPASKALNHMCAEMAEKEKTRSTNKFLVEFINKEYPELKELEEEEKDKKMLTRMREEVLSMDDSSRCIVFVETREVCKHLSDYLQSILPKGKKCGFVMSSRSAGSSLINQSHSDQSQTLKDFRDGIITVMVATTVANEGIDIPQCNLIIKYNMTGNVISKVQQEGRARAKDSRSILIVLSESVLERERENLAAQVRMKRILEGIHREGKTKLAMDISDIMKRLEKEAKREEEEERRKADDLSMNRFDILCVKCYGSICPSHSIKTDPFSSSYYSIDPDIWSKIIIQIPRRPKSQSQNAISYNVADILCANCLDEGKGSENKIGKLYRLSSCYLPSLRINELKFRDSDTGEFEEEIKTGWDGVHGTKIYVSKIREEEMMRTLTKLKEYDNITYNKLEVRVEEIERRLSHKTPIKSGITVDSDWDD
ncbi:hypothetical protein PENTCL1PPCAC_11419, partial [Pristionchus entomophagus]